MRRVTHRSGHHYPACRLLGAYALQMGIPVGATALDDVRHVFVEEQVMHVRYAQAVANLEKRGSYRPRRVREQRAYRLVVAIRMLVSPTVTALYPHMSHMAVKSRDQAIRFLKKHSLTLAAPFFACSLILLAFAPLITKLLYGHKYLATIPLMRVLAFSPFFLALQQVYSTFFMLAFGYQKEWSKVIFKATVLNFILLIPMIYGMWPPMAVAITGLVLDAFVTFVTFQFYRKHAVSTPAAVEL